MNRKSTILVVDDQPENLDILTSLLAERGYRVQAAINGDIALKVAKKSPPDLVLLDILMPQMDGYEVSNRLKEDALTRDIPIIFISALDATQDKVKAFRAGGVDYVVKPFQVEEVLARVETHLSLQRMQRELVYAQKMETVGRLAGGIAHEFNNLLTSVTGYAHFVKESLPPESSSYEDIEEVIKAADRLADLTRHLLAFARRQIIMPQELNLNKEISDMEETLRTLTGDRVQLVLAPASDLNVIKVDPGQIQQVIASLALNARDAMPDGGTFTIETANVTLVDADIVDRFDVKAGEYVKLSISDTGRGMSREVLTRLFEPFYTTKDIGEGTGLGLAAVYGIVRQHGGDIRVSSEEGDGSRFEIYLPRAENDFESR